MKFGFTLPDHGPLASIENVLKAGTEAEALGYDSIWVGDFSITHTRDNHRFNVACGSAEDVDPDSDPNFVEPFTAMAALAAQTKSIRIGSCAIQLPLYNPLTFAKQATALDLLSGGRVTLGIGIGSAIRFFRRGYDHIHFPFPRRGYIFDEYITAVEQLWRSKSPSSFNGKYLQFSDLELYPKPTKSLKILIGSGVAEKGLRRVMDFSDGVILSFRTPSESKTNVATISDEAKKRGSDISEFEIAQTIFTCIGRTTEEARSVLTPTIATHAEGFGTRAMNTDEQAHRKRNLTVEDLLRMSFVGTADEIIKQIETFEAAGVNHAIMLLTFRGKTAASLLEAMKTFATEVMPSFQ
ncbi:MAG: LLM class flavin-dependent oxidoreductase [Nitrososphaerales archaeon]